MKSSMPASGERGDALGDLVVAADQAGERAAVGADRRGAGADLHHRHVLVGAGDEARAVVEGAERPADAR